MLGCSNPYGFALHEGEVEILRCLSIHFILREDCCSSTTCYDLYFQIYNFYTLFAIGFQLHVHSTASQLVAGAALIP